MKTYEGWISKRFIDSELAGAFRTDGPEVFRRSGIDSVRATLTIGDDETQSVYQYRYRNSAGNWLITRRLYTRDDAQERFGGSCEFEVHAGPFEVPE